MTTAMQSPYRNHLSVALITTCAQPSGNGRYAWLHLTPRFRGRLVLAGLLFTSLAVTLAACTPAVAPGAPTMAGRYADTSTSEQTPISSSSENSKPAEVERSPEPAAPVDDYIELAPLPESTKAPLMRRGSINRSALTAVLDRGPGAFLRGIEVRPHFRDRRFAGWRLVDIAAEHQRLGGLDLKPGDIILAVNDRRIIRPRHLHALWNELRASAAIVVRAERNGRPFELHFDVTDPPTARP